MTTGESGLRFEWRDADSLTENPANWRKHPPYQEAALRDVLAYGMALQSKVDGRWKTLQETAVP